MISLAALQGQFQERLLSDDRRILHCIDQAQNVAADARLEIYAQAYRLRLTEALASNFPRLSEYVGAAAFAGIAQAYIASHPSRFRSIRWVGAELAAHLAQSHPHAPWLADLARWEWALAAAFDAPDAEPIGDAALAAVAPARWPALRFDLHPSLQTLRIESNAPALFKALTADDSPPVPAMLAAPQSWLIWRHGLTPRYRSLDEVELRALAAASTGASFEDMCDALCTMLEADAVPLRAATLLKAWVADALIVGVRD